MRRRADCIAVRHEVSVMCRNRSASSSPRRRRAGTPFLNIFSSRRRLMKGCFARWITGPTCVGGGLCPSYQIINSLQIDGADVQTEGARTIRMTYLLALQQRGAEGGGQTRQTNGNFPAHKGNKWSCAICGAPYRIGNSSSLLVGRRDREGTLL